MSVAPSLKIPDFRRLFFAVSISRLGNAFTAVALALGILDSTNSATDIGIVLAARQLAQVLFLLLGGAWADRVSRRTLLIQTYVISGATQAAFGVMFLTHTGSLWVLVPLAIINGISVAFSMPASAGVIPQLVPAELRQNANALLGLMRNSATIAGSVAAGVLVGATSPGWALLADAVSFFVGAVLLARIRLLPPRPPSTGLLKDLRDGWTEFIARTWVWTIVLQFTFVNMAYIAAMNVYAPILLRHGLGGPRSYGALLGGIGVGAVGSGFVLLRKTPRRPLVIATLGVLVAIPVTAALAATLPLWSVLVLAVVSGAGIETFSVLWASALQDHIPEDRLSRVSAYDALGSFAFTPIALALAGPLLHLTGSIHTALWALVAVMAIPTLIVLAVPSVWSVRRTAPDAVAA